MRMFLCCLKVDLVYWAVFKVLFCMCVQACCLKVLTMGGKNKMVMASNTRTVSANILMTRNGTIKLSDFGIASLPSDSGER